MYKVRAWGWGGGGEERLILPKAVILCLSAEPRFLGSHSKKGRGTSGQYQQGLIPKLPSPSHFAGGSVMGQKKAWTETWKVWVLLQLLHLVAE